MINGVWSNNATLKEQDDFFLSSGLTRGQLGIDKKTCTVTPQNCEVLSYPDYATGYTKPLM